MLVNDNTFNIFSSLQIALYIFYIQRSTASSVFGCLLISHLTLFMCPPPDVLQVRLQPEALQGCGTRPAPPGDQVSMVTVQQVPQVSIQRSPAVAFLVWLHQGSQVDLDSGQAQPQALVYEYNVSLSHLISVLKGVGNFRYCWLCLLAMQSCKEQHNVHHLFVLK